jgi:hypothetical protein
MKPTPDQTQRAVEMKLAGRPLTEIRDALQMTEGQVNKAWREYRKANPDVPRLPNHNPTKPLTKEPFMRQFRCAGLRGIRSDDGREAAHIFATRLAKKKYGRSAYVRTLNVDSYSQDGSVSNYQAFVGVRTGSHETTGSNIYFTVFTD